MDLAELRHVVVHEGLRLVGMAAQHLDVRLHRNRLAEHEDQLVLPEELVHELLCGDEVPGALLRQLVLRIGGDLLRKTEQQLHVLHRHHAPTLLGEGLREQVAVHLHGLVELLLAHADLRPAETALHVEVKQVRAGLRDRLEEFVVDLPALRHHPARVVRVRHREAERPVLALLTLLALQRVDDLLHGLELAEAQVALQLEDLQLRSGIGPFLLGRRDDGLGEVRHVRLDERFDEGDFLRQRGIGGRRLKRLPILFLRRGARRQTDADGRRRQRANYGLAQFHGVKYNEKNTPRQVRGIKKREPVWSPPFAATDSFTCR